MTDSEIRSNVTLTREHRLWTALVAVAPHLLPVCTQAQPSAFGGPTNVNVDVNFLKNISMMIATALVDAHQDAMVKWRLDLAKAEADDAALSYLGKAPAGVKS